MTIESEVLIQDLIERTRININNAQKFKSLQIEVLNWKKEHNTWSILECFEHLNLYGAFYNPEIESKIQLSKTTSKHQFKSGVLGNYFAKSMMPKEKLNTMKTFKNKNPLGIALDKATIDTFILQQEQMLTLLDAARQVDLTKTKTGITISKLITLRLGDTFRVVVYHNDRHMVQANNVLEQQKKA